MTSRAVLVVVLTYLSSAVLLAENRVTSGELTLERPTLICLSFEWSISGDDNRNSAVSLQYRKVGEDDWHAALPLLRLDNERTFAEVVPPVSAPAGDSIEPAYLWRLV